MVEADPQMSQAFPREWPADTEVESRMAPVRAPCRPSKAARGADERDEIENKFRELADVAISPAAADRVIAAVWDLDRHKGIDQVLQAVAGGLRERPRT